MSDTRQTEVIRLIDPLPCGVVNPSTATGFCGRPAWVAYAWRDAGGLWMLQPVCPDCVKATAQRYGVTPEGA